MNWRVEVKADSTGTWAGNGLTFATKREATEYGADLSFRWTSVRDMRTVETEEPTTHRWTGTHVESLDDA